MLTLEKNKNSKYIVYVGWAGVYYATSMNEINNIIWAYGINKVKYKSIK